MITSGYSRSLPLRQSTFSQGSTNRSSGEQKDVFHRELQSAVSSLTAQEQDWSTMVLAWSKKKI